MARRNHSQVSIESDDRSTHLSDYEQLAVSVASASPDDIGRQLPGLTDKLTSLTQDRGDLRGFIIGVSYTRNYSLFDYELYEIIGQGSEEPRTNLVIEPVNENHHYISFSYPADPYFDNAALRGVILAELDRRIHELSGIDPSEDETPFSELWGLLADRKTGGE